MSHLSAWCLLKSERKLDDVQCRTLVTVLTNMLTVFYIAKMVEIGAAADFMDSEARDANSEAELQKFWAALCEAIG